MMNIKGFLCYDPEARRTRISCNVIFVEHNPFYSLKPDFHPINVSYLPYFPVTSNPTLSSTDHKVL